MHGGVLAGWLMAALCAVSGASCLLRARTGTPQERRTARSEALMGFGMAAMALPAAVLTPPEWAWAVYGVVFGFAALRALRWARHGGHHLHHLVGSLAMVYMAVAMAPAVAGAGGHAGHGAAGGGGTGGLPLLTGALLVYFALYVLRSAGHLIPAGTAVAGFAGGSAEGVVRGGGGGGPGGTAGGGSELTAACRLTMGLAMFAMLLTL
ncbi:DUF5134 domain-containing protein [Streptomyces bacillaris]|uniref:DUF5134 domain-containing protein n=1 Tax=unclassified Streptomyces TaxID=2593676 RepID=UPI00048B5989|nr:DUF5134 domain-containing protein [Streptomyces sp. SolWspMP-sol2th]MYT94667.1 DUF5134 domain-containing protein [Streptomyces sp. SID8359]